MVRRWISESQRIGQKPCSSPGFVPVSLSAAVSHSRKIDDKPGSIRIKISRAGRPVMIEWPSDQANQCVALLNELLQ